MNSNLMPSIVQIDTNELKELITVVNETVAPRMIKVKGSKSRKARFGIVDLWKIQRGMKSATASRRNF